MLYQRKNQEIRIRTEGTDAVVTQLRFDTVYTSRDWMIHHNMTRDEAEQALIKQFNRRQDLILALQERGGLCKECAQTLDIAVIVGGTFTDVTEEAKTPHVSYQETITIDLKKIENADDNLQAVFAEYGLPTEDSKSYRLTLESLQAAQTFLFADTFQYGSFFEITESKEEKLIKQGAPDISFLPSVPEYEFMKIPLAVREFSGIGYQAKYDDETDDALIVPWNYCIEGSYQTTRTGYWSKCNWVVERIYDEFGNYSDFLPRNTGKLEYKIVEGGYYVRSGTIQSLVLLDCLAKADKAVEIPTPFDLYRFSIGNGFDGIHFTEKRDDGTTWEYDIDIAEEEGFFLSIHDGNAANKNAFTYFYGGDVRKLYQELAKKGNSIRY